MGRKYFIIIIIVAVIILLGLFFYNRYVGEIISFEKPPQNIQTEETETPLTYTSEQVSVHSAEDDCWMIVGDKVYDVTQYIPFHPGGKMILGGCGKDATELFMTRPTNLNTPHPEEAFQKLEDYYIGDFRQ